jgi:hypothetical protein
MQSAASLIFAGKSLVVSAILLCWLSTFPTAVAHGQTSVQGQDAVYNSSGNVTSSPSFIDASMFAQTGSNICKILNGILSGTSTTYPTSGAVIDARGLPNSTPPTSMTCAAGTTPWKNGTTTVSAPSTVLAGGPELR